MKISLQDPNQRLLFFLAAIILILSLLAVDRYLYPPAGSGFITIGLLLMFLGIVGAVLYDILYYQRRLSAHCYPEGGTVPGQTGSGNPWAQKANLYLTIWCLSIPFVIFIGLLLTIIIFSSIIILLAGIVLAFFVMNWSEGKYVDAVRWIDPDLVAGWNFIPVKGGAGPLFFGTMITGLYTVFAGWALSGFISSILIPVVPESVAMILPPLICIAFAFFATPAIILLVFWRWE